MPPTRYCRICANKVLDIPGPALLSSMTQNSSAKSNTASHQGFSAFASFTSAPTSQSPTPQPPPQSAFSPPLASSEADPFAILSGATSPRPAQAKPSASNDDEEWSFSSALPPEAPPPPPREHRATVNNSMVKVDMFACRSSAAPNAMVVLFSFSNNSAQQVTELHYQIAVTRVRVIPPPFFLNCLTCLPSILTFC